MKLSKIFLLLKFNFDTLFAIFGTQQGLMLEGLGISDCQCVQSFHAQPNPPHSSYKISSILAFMFQLPNSRILAHSHLLVLH